DAAAVDQQLAPLEQLALVHIEQPGAAQVDHAKRLLYYADRNVLAQGAVMEVEDFILISVDDHLIEPPDVFLDHLPATYQDRAPKLVRRDDGADVWQFNGATIENSALNAVAGRPKEEYGLEPQSLEDVRPGCSDEHD